MTSFKSKWSDWEPEQVNLKPASPPVEISNTPKYGTSKTVKSPFAGFAGTTSKGSEDLKRVTEDVIRDRLIAECRAKSVELQAWLTTHLDEHMATEPFGSAEWVAAMANFLVVERSQLRSVFGYTGCIHDSGSCPVVAPVSCTACEGTTQ